MKKIEEYLLKYLTPKYVLCNECECWESDDLPEDPDHGVCYRHPPVPTKGYPVTRRYKGCWEGVQK